VRALRYRTIPKLGSRLLRVGVLLWAPLKSRLALMSTWTPLKADVLAAIAQQAMQHQQAGRVIVAIDGVDGAGKTHFADELADVLRASGHTVVRASVDGFHNPRDKRYARGKLSPQGFYLDSYNYEAFTTALLDPFRAGESTVMTAVFDHTIDAEAIVTVNNIPATAVLVLDGIFLHRPQLRGTWNFSIWLDVPQEISEHRLRARDGESGVSDRYSEGQKLYIAEASPRTSATVIVDNSNFESPRQVFADSC